MARFLRCFQVVANEFLEDVLVGILRHRDVDLVDKVLPSFLFCNEDFIVCDSTIRDVELHRVVAQPSQSASVDVVEMDSSIRKGIEDEIIEDSKEGVLVAPVVKHKVVWQCVGGIDAWNLALVCRLRPRKLARGTSRLLECQEEVIDISKDGKVEKVVDWLMRENSCSCNFALPFEFVKGAFPPSTYTEM
ncbi:unnamed protein product [Lactuca saligna]|nr:unnamed protein product [Lactuca saligna]